MTDVPRQTLQGSLGGTRTLERELGRGILRVEELRRFAPFEALILAQRS